MRLTDYENFDTADEDLDLPFTEIFNETPKSIYTTTLTQRTEKKLSLNEFKRINQNILNLNFNLKNPNMNIINKFIDIFFIFL